MKKQFPYLIFIFFVLFSMSGFSQKSSKKKDKDYGFDFFFNVGMYLGNKNNANYYSGDPYNDPDPNKRKYGDPNVFYVLKNKYWWEEIENLIDEKNREVIINTLRFENSSGMRYNLAFGFGIGVRYRFSETFGVSFLFSQARLTSQGSAYFAVKSTGVNLDIGNIKYLDYPLIGRERRSFYEMHISYFIPTEIPAVYPFFELGAHINSTKVLSSELIIEDVHYSIINNYGEGTSYMPGIEYPEVNPHLGGIGYGFMGGLGLRLAFNKWAAIEPVIQVNAEKLALSSYGKIKLNYNFMVRLVVGDKVFSKKE